MGVATSYLTIALSGLFLGVGTAKIFRAPSMLLEARRLGFSARSYQYIGAAELAGAVGMLASLRWPLLGVVTAGALFVLTLGALWVLRRAGEPLRARLPALAAAGLAVVTAVMIVLTRPELG